MKVCIFGGGAIGGHIAARIAKSGSCEVSIFCRGEALDAIRSRGLRLEAADGDFTVQPKASDDPAELGSQDIIITALKSHSLPAAVPAIRGLMDENTAVVFAVNGVPWWYFEDVGGDSYRDVTDLLDPGRALRDGIGVARTLGCVIRAPSATIAPGHVRSESDSTRFAIGEPAGPNGERVSRVVDLFAGAGMGGVEVDNIREDMWQKLLANFAGSTMCCMTDHPGGYFAEDPVLWDQYCRLSWETVDVARAYGFELDPQLEWRRNWILKTNHKASMAQDLDAGRAMEIDAQLTAVVQLARAAGVATPLSDILVPLVQARAVAAGLYTV